MAKEGNGNITQKSTAQSVNKTKLGKHIESWNLFFASLCSFSGMFAMSCLQKLSNCLHWLPCYLAAKSKYINHDAYVRRLKPEPNPWKTHTFRDTIGSLDLESKAVAQCQPWPTVTHQHQMISNWIAQKHQKKHQIMKSAQSNASICQIIVLLKSDCPVSLCMGMALSQWPSDGCWRRGAKTQPGTECQTSNVLRWAFLPLAVILLAHVTCSMQSLNLWTNASWSRKLHTKPNPPFIDPRAWRSF